MTPRVGDDGETLNSHTMYRGASGDEIAIGRDLVTLKTCVPLSPEKLLHVVNRSHIQWYLLQPYFSWYKSGKTLQYLIQMTKHGYK